MSKQSEKSAKKKSVESRDVRRTLAFVDAVVGADARLLVETKTWTVPVACLPAGAKEGVWIAMDTQVVPPPDNVADLEKRRARLAKNDPGGDIKL